MLHFEARNRARIGHSPLALALHALPAGNLTFAGGIERSVANLDLTLSLVMADDQAICRDAGPSQLERMRRRAVGEQLFAAAKHDRHCEDAHSVDQVIGEQRVDEFRSEEHTSELQ